MRAIDADVSRQHVQAHLGALVAADKVDSANPAWSAFELFLVIRRLIQGPEAEGLFTLFAILFLLVGAEFLALGVLGEYVGRIYVEVRRRPRSVVKETINFSATVANGANAPNPPNAANAPNGDRG